jgi:acetyl-CoA carboxylase alpha subunit
MENKIEIIMSDSNDNDIDIEKDFEKAVERLYEVDKVFTRDEVQEMLYKARAIAENLLEFSNLNVPVIAIVLSEGGSGGALALTISDYVYMFENAVYSVLSPEGFSSILFHDKITAKEASDYMKMTASDLSEYGIVDEIIPEPLGGVKYLSDDYVDKIKTNLINKLKELLAKDKEELLAKRYNKYRKIGA